MNDDKPKKKLNNVSTKTPSEYEQEVRSVAESLSVFGGGLVLC